MEIPTSLASSRSAKCRSCLGISLRYVLCRPVLSLLFTLWPKVKRVGHPDGLQLVASHYMQADIFEIELHCKAEPSYSWSLGNPFGHSTYPTFIFAFSTTYQLELHCKADPSYCWSLDTPFSCITYPTFPFAQPTGVLVVRPLLTPSPTSVAVMVRRGRTT
ncbi:hypothetical protein BKA93DRAFT_474862 [Sparassis latifolia]